MPSAGFFKRFGIFVRPGFLPPELCRQLVAEMVQSASRSATVGGVGEEYVVDEEIRKALLTDVTTETVKQADSLFTRMGPELSSYFQIPLDHHQPLQFLHYRTGDHYIPHRDARSDPDASAVARERKVSVVVFLNNQSGQALDGTFAGGSLTFYRLMKAPGMENFGMPLEPEAGLLVAFRSDVIHEVNPVTGGERYTLVSWFA